MLMADTILYMSMSLDGFIAGPDDGPGLGLGRDGHRLHDWLTDGGITPQEHRPATGPSAQVFDEVMSTGAVITGRRTFELAGGWAGDHHDGVPVYVLTRTPPATPAPGHARYVTDVRTCVEQAKAAAGDRDILVHGARTAQGLLRAGLLDQMEIHLIPVLLGDGRRLFEGLGPEHIELELVRTMEAPGVTHHRYRVRTD
jgi:dihydrofolate reductase